MAAETQAKTDRADQAVGTVRAAFIGVGARGSGHLATMMSLEGVEIVAIADNHEPSLRRPWTA